jgi:hypothetical protein
LREVPIGTGTSQAQWSARELKWEAAAADVIVEGRPLPGPATPLVKPQLAPLAPSGPKGVGDELLRADVGDHVNLWPGDQPPLPQEGPGCRIHFVLLE